MTHYLPQIPKLRIYFSADKAYATKCYDIKRTVRSAIRATLFHESIDASVEVSVSFTTNDAIRQMNKEYREKDSATDVLSFPLYTREEIEAAKENTEEHIELGDIVISLERAAEQAKELGNSYLREVAFLTVHSTLHLLGYDHELSPEEEEKQCARQREIMDTLDVTSME